MDDFKNEIIAAQRRLLIKILDFYYTGEDMSELIWECEYLTGYVKPSFASAAGTFLDSPLSNQQSAPVDPAARTLRDYLDIL